MFSFKFKVLCAFTAIYLVWGSTYLFVKVSLHSFPPFLLSSLRFFIGGGAVMMYAYWKREQFPKSKELIKQAILGCIIFMGGIMTVGLGSTTPIIELSFDYHHYAVLVCGLR